MRLEYKGAGDLDDVNSYNLTTLYQNTTGVTNRRTIAIADVDSDHRWDILITSIDVTDSTEAAVTIIENDQPEHFVSDGLSILFLRIVGSD